MSTSDYRPVLIVIAGPNGSGKTTITSKILRHEWLEDAIYINPDQVAQDKFGDGNSPEAVMQAAQYCEQQREQCLHDRQSLCYALSYICFLSRFTLSTAHGRSVPSSTRSTSQFNKSSRSTFMPATQSATALVPEHLP